MNETIEKQLAGNPKDEYCPDPNCSGQLAVIRGRVMVPSKTMLGTVVAEDSPRARRQVYVGCGKCDTPVALDHPRQVKLDAEWDAAEKAEKAEHAQRMAFSLERQQERQFKLKQLTDDFAATGCEISALSGGTDGSRYVVDVRLSFPLSKLEELRELAKKTAVQTFQSSQQGKRLADVKKQLADAKSEQAGKLAALGQAEQDYRAALSRGTGADKVESKLATLKASAAALETRIKLLEESIIPQAQRAAVESFNLTDRDHKHALRQNLIERDRELSIAWRKAAAPGLVDLLAGRMSIERIDRPDLF
jgi:hypothetical protein